MKGNYRFIDKDNAIVSVDDTDKIPDDAQSLIEFGHPPVPDPPHTAEDHAFIASIREEFREVYKRIYGMYPPEPRNENAKHQS